MGSGTGLTVRILFNFQPLRAIYDYSTGINLLALWLKYVELNPNFRPKFSQNQVPMWIVILSSCYAPCKYERMKAEMEPVERKASYTLSWQNFP